MKDALRKTIEEIALLIVMTDGKDAMGREGIKSMLTTAREQLAGIPGTEALQKEFSVDAIMALSGNPFCDAVNQLTSKLQSFLERGEAPTAQANPEFGAHFDAEFLPEFIERHSLLLEDFEGEIVSFQVKTSALTLDDMRHYARKYLHNIKGDAGAIGLVGIEQVTHYLEDEVDSLSADTLAEKLLSYREWLREVFRSLVTGEPFLVPSAAFIQQLHGTATDSLVETEIPSPVGQSAISLEAIDAMSSSNGSHESTLPSSYSLTVDRELYLEFKQEAEDHLSNVEALLLEKGIKLETSDIDTVFRGVHSLKGASSYFNLVEINRTSHDLETILDEARSGKRVFSSALEVIVLQWIDLQKQLLISALQSLETGGTVTTNPESQRFLGKLADFYAGRSVERSVPGDVAPPPAAPESEIKEGGRAQLDVKSFVKVDTQRLDRLIDSIGEMVIYSSMLIRICRELLGDNERVIQTTDQVEKFSRELQDIGMSMRLDPLRGLFQKMSRLVWDIGKKLKKEVKFSMKGEDTELDRTVIEKLADPLMHMIRNALDHGIEPPEERLRTGKAPTGTIELSAAHVGGSIVVTVRDDGRGLDPEKLTRKAKEKGILQQDAVLSPEDAYQLIFAPGFSTAAQVTDLSGRGVGMDVVRNNIQSMRGQVRIDSELGKGTTFTIELPLTLAIIDGIETELGSERFILPTLSVVEFMRPRAEMFSTTAGRGEMFFFRGQFLPVYRLGRLFEIDAPSNTPAAGVVVIADCAGELVALVVDSIVGSCQAVIKRLGDIFGDNEGFAGCAIMPNGDIGLILDVRSVVAAARRSYEPLELTELHRESQPLLQ